MVIHVTGDNVIIATNRQGAATLLKHHYDAVIFSDEHNELDKACEFLKSKNGTFEMPLTSAYEGMIPNDYKEDISPEPTEPKTNIVYAYYSKAMLREIAVCPYCSRVIYVDPWDAETHCEHYLTDGIEYVEGGQRSYVEFKRPEASKAFVGTMET